MGFIVLFKWYRDVRVEPYEFQPEFISALTQRIGLAETNQLVKDFFDYDGDKLTSKAIKTRIHPIIIDLFNRYEGYKPITDVPFIDCRCTIFNKHKLYRPNILKIGFDTVVVKRIHEYPSLGGHVETWRETLHEPQVKEGLIREYHRAEAAEKEVIELRLLLAQAAAQIYRQGSHSN